MSKKRQFTRRDMLKITAAGSAAGVLGKAYADTVPIGIDDPVLPPAGANAQSTVALTGCALDADLYPTSPFILNPFTDPLPVPAAMKPGYRNPDGTITQPNAWRVRTKLNDQPAGVSVPGFGPGYQDALGDRPMANDGRTFTFRNPKTNALTTKTMNFGGARCGTHQLYPGGRGTSYGNLSGQAKATFDALAANPILYHIRVGVHPYSFTTSDVQPINASGVPIPLPPGASASGRPIANGGAPGTFKFPASTQYNFNGTFVANAFINVEYGRPVIVRMENDLDQNPGGLSRGDFGAPDWAYLTHLHNGHTAPESDGQPNHMQDNRGGYLPGQWSDNLYTNFPAGGLDAEKQSTLWFHDHRMHHTGPNVYKGMVGFMPHYDPFDPTNPTATSATQDSGDERVGLRLPGVRTNNLDGTFDVKYDLPIVLYDCRMDDGITQHKDVHQPLAATQWSNNVCGNTHPEWWGTCFLQHYPNHGFVGDIFTVNGTAYPVLHVEPRRYRLRFLGASLARQYELSLRQPAAGTGLAPVKGSANNPVLGQGQWSFGAARQGGRFTYNLGTQVMKMTQIASEGGLLPTPILRDSLQVWPAKRREVVVDFSVFQDGSSARGATVYLTNTAVMTDGRQQTGNLAQGGAFAVPLVKIVIDLPLGGTDNSDPRLQPVPGRFDPSKSLRARLTPPPNPAQNDMDFTLVRQGLGGETEWAINSLQFDPLNPLWAPNLNSFEFWGINNGGGGWTHPMHIHMEEHQVTARTALNLADEGDPIGKADVVALQPSEQTTIYRGFRTFLGNYVAHCHNLAHEDHNMMFGWCITKP